MAEDDMLLNFSVPDVLATTPSFKGGRWKDRLSARKAAETWHKKHALGEGKSNKKEWETKTPNYASGDGSDVEDEVVAEHRETRPVKKQRTVVTLDDHKSNDIGRHGGKGVKQKPKQVISSLFSFNPKSKTRLEHKPNPDEEKALEPSNAPLRTELDTFTSLGLSSVLAAHLLNKLDLKAPTAIQKAAITQLIKNDSDAFIQAETGSGKTLSYLLPLVQRLMNLSQGLKELGSDAVHRDTGLFAIILAPTRELSKQISVVLERLLGCAHWLVSGTVVGGEKKKSEKARLRKGLNILVATPGRLADHLEHTEVLDVSNVRWLVLDEGDRLMELGFEDEIQRIVARLNMRMKQNTSIPGLPTKRMTVLCSATMKMDVQRLGEISLKEAVHISASPEDLNSDENNDKDKTFSAPAQLKQSYAVVPAKLRLVSLIALLKRTFARRGSVMKAIIFMSCADTVNFHYEVFIREAGKDQPENGAARAKENKNDKFSISTNMDTQTSAVSPSLSSKDNEVRVFKLHGSLVQAVRTSTLAAYSKCKDASILICTDVASRGLDVPDVDFVIEYDPAFSKEDHLHRIGRTARAGRDGRALIFLQPGPEEGYVDILNESGRDAGKGLVRHDAEELLKKGFTTTGVISMAPSWENEATEFQLNLERWALASPQHLAHARRAYQSHVRAYATHVAAERHIFNIKELHLGHLAKAFALRDKPGSINVPGLRGGNESGRGGKKASSGGKRASNSITRDGTGSKENRQDKIINIKGDNEFDSVVLADEQDAKRRMRMKMKQVLAGASEFNLG